MTKSRRRRERRKPALSLRPWKITRNPFPPLEPLSADEVEAIHEASLKILAVHGMRIDSPRARGILKAAGNRVVESEAMVYFDPGFIVEALKTAPSGHQFVARNPAKTAIIGGNSINFIPVGGPAFVSDLDKGRRAGSFEDLCNFLRLTQMLGILHYTNTLCLEPLDLPVETRHLDRAYAAATLTDKAFSCSIMDAAQARDAMQIACIIHGVDFEDLPNQGRVIMAGGINTNSPRILDEGQAEGMLAMAEMGQAVNVTPFTLLGAMAPVTLAGALALQNAEALACLSLIQTARPGSPMLYGGFTSNVDMKSGAPAFGTPEYVKATLAGGQMARRYNLPYRSSSTTSANIVDAQAAYESKTSIWAAVMGHANQINQSAGWLEGGLTASFEKLIVDAEMLQMMAESLEPIPVDAESLAIDAIGEVPPGGHFFGEAHTLERYKTAFYQPIVSDRRNFESWTEDGEQTTLQRANRIWKQMLKEYAPPAIDPAVDEALKDFVARRKREIGREGL